ncbi:putative sodium-coupled neutral amino acid transporter 10 [Amphibalanus amphitrite]|uniref:putative sodium-coupled neutral amino acid transporter 10 n=1 Tax=Amphibalanus amphitrite TaxID=1232801 RepID=UPI001C90F7DE|nr:putative sodium-coupled neutral amino acid transporter 10 [Amphibalanus amphitrite]XP_043198618.1 putative sodium-coupled neutral amino acid transporter 10 [Amphibalanus amphitrite]XP_043198619.1 putative sodium-coupled neutral amino acid transporter 10 [Amphibalanus amphitrite]XP_043198620.1 putative sodium-coupled neutral amino acid transporter 10 [Amphibalanus amphitrite]XP_043198621.1 putative sodium-coupled neutral amino acid transporter 10 [Amphibalanus amphitrite]XP_043198623.1 putat
MSENNLKQILTLGNSIIGVSILAMPYCLKQCGLILGILLLIISGYINRINCHFLIKSAISTKRRSYEFLAFHIFGPTGKFAIEVIQIGFLFGICVSFFVIAGDLGPKILAQLLEVECTPRFRAFFLCGMCFFIVLPLSLLRNTDSLASISAISITFYVLLVLKIVADSWSHIVSGSWQAEVELWRPAGVLQALPIMSLALACQTNVFSIYESLPDPSLSRMNTVVSGAINLCSSVYILVGFFGYVAFHDVSFGGNILVHLVPSPVTRWINIGFVMSIALGFPLVVYPCRVSVNSLLFRRPGSSLELPQNHIPELRFKCITFCILSSAMCIGIVIPSIEVVLGLLGSTMGTAIAILFPSVMFIKNNSRNNLEKMAAQMSFILGIVLLVCGTYMNLYAVDKLAQEPAVIPVAVPAVTAPAVVPSAGPVAVGGGLSNVTDKRDIIPDNPPGDKQREEEKAADAPQEEARKEPAIPEPPMEDQKPAVDVAEKPDKDTDAKRDGDDEKPASKKRKASDEKAADGEAEAINSADDGAGKKKSGNRSKHRGSKKTAGADEGGNEVEDDVEADVVAGDSKKRSADAVGGGEGLDVGALQKEEEERERDDALRPEDPQAKKLELKQEAVLQKLEETHKEQKELLQAQKALLDEMKQQRSEQAAAGGQQQAQPAQQVARQPYAAQQSPDQGQPNVPGQQIPAAAQAVAGQGPGVQSMGGQVPAQAVPGQMPAGQPLTGQLPPGQVMTGQVQGQGLQGQLAPGQAAGVQVRAGQVTAGQMPAGQAYGAVGQQQVPVAPQPAAPQQQQYVLNQPQVNQVPNMQQGQQALYQQQGQAQQPGQLLQAQQVQSAQQAQQQPPQQLQYQQQPQQQYQQPQQIQQSQQAQQQQQFQQASLNQPAPAAVELPSVQKPAAVPAAADRVASRREKAAQVSVDGAKKKRKQVAHDRMRRDAGVSAIKDEMLVGLPENWAAMEAVGVGASSHKRR